MKEKIFHCMKNESFQSTLFSPIKKLISQVEAATQSIKKLRSRVEADTQSLGIFMARAVANDFAKSKVVLTWILDVIGLQVISFINTRSIPNCLSIFSIHAF